MSPQPVKNNLRTKITVCTKLTTQSNSEYKFEAPSFPLQLHPPAMSRRSGRVAEDALTDPPPETEAQRQQRKTAAREVKLRNREDQLKKAEEQRVSAAREFARDDDSDGASVGAGEEGGASATAGDADVARALQFEEGRRSARGTAEGAAVVEVALSPASKEREEQRKASNLALSLRKDKEDAIEVIAPALCSLR